jgi:DNA-binding LacI/PurR family transcriptional regulator
MQDGSGQSFLSELKLNPFSSEQLHLQIQRQMREKIQTHQLVPGEKLPTNHEMSAALKVSYKTVQRAMSELADLGVIVRRQKRGTFVNQTLGSQTIGIFCTQTVFNPQASPYSWLMARHLCDTLHDQERDGQIYYVREGTRVESNKAFRDLMRDLEERRLSGLIFLGYSPEEAPHQAELMETARRRGIPAIAITVREICSYTIWLDQLDFCRRGFRHLAERGCRRVALLGATSASKNCPPAAILRAAEAESVLLKPEDMIAGLLGSTAKALVLGEQWGAEFDLDTYDGALIGDDIVAVGFARGLRRRKARVPEELHVATMWNRGNPMSLALPFVRFEVDVGKWAQRSVAMLDALIEGREVDESHVYVKLGGPVEPETLAASQFMEALSC